MANLVGQITMRERRTASGARQVPCSMPSCHSYSFMRSNYAGSTEGQIGAAFLELFGVSLHRCAQHHACPEPVPKKKIELP